MDNNNLICSEDQMLQQVHVPTIFSAPFCPEHNTSRAGAPISNCPKRGGAGRGGALK